MRPHSTFKLIDWSSEESNVKPTLREQSTEKRPHGSRWTATPLASFHQLKEDEDCEHLKIFPERQVEEKRRREFPEHISIRIS